MEQRSRDSANEKRSEPLVVIVGILAESDAWALPLVVGLSSTHAFGTLTSINSFATVTADCAGPSSDCWPVT